MCSHCVGIRSRGKNTRRLETNGGSGLRERPFVPRTQRTRCPTQVSTSLNGARLRPLGKCTDRFDTEQRGSHRLSQKTTSAFNDPGTSTNSHARRRCVAAASDTSDDLGIHHAQNPPGDLKRIGGHPHPDPLVLGRPGTRSPFASGTYRVRSCGQGDESAISKVLALLMKSIEPVGH